MRYIVSKTIRTTAALSLLALTCTADGAVRPARVGQHPADAPAVSHQVASPRGGADRVHNLHRAVDNEMWLMILDQALVEVRDRGGTYLVAIARLGKGERDARLNKRRLARIEELMSGRGNAVRIVAATGDRVPELGRIELYVSNELFAVLPPIAGPRSGTSSCEPSSRS